MEFRKPKLYQLVYGFGTVSFQCKWSVGKDFKIHENVGEGDYGINKQVWWVTH